MMKLSKYLSEQEQRDQLLKMLEWLLVKVSDAPMARRIRAICNVRLIDPESLLNEAQKEEQALIHKNWIITLIWVLSFETKALDEEGYPFNLPIFQFFEPLGRKQHADLLLWDDCLTFAKSHKVRHALGCATAINGWFMSSLQRMCCAYDCVFTKTTKRETIDSLKREIAALEKLKNPVDPQEQPSLYNLIEVAIAIATHNPSDCNELRMAKRQFRKFRWEAYILAHRKWCQRFQGIDGKAFDFQVPFIDGDKLKVPVTGRQTQTIFPYSQSFLKLPRKK